ncbi:MAG TPA: HXXEE domain-containing protein [Gemmatimonadaceae bacterium]|nr:HXXEE domain-containing protein [Gemmatimonadaceae bacterium]
MSNRAATTFGLLILAQAAHSIEEYAGRLWESFPPARFVSGLVSDDLRLGFLLLNVALLTFGVWCYWWPVSRRWRSARAVALGWALVELVNGLGHPLWSVRQGGYTPGVATALILLILAGTLLVQMRTRSTGT